MTNIDQDEIRSDGHAAKLKSARALEIRQAHELFAAGHDKAAIAAYKAIIAEADTSGFRRVPHIIYARCGLPCHMIRPVSEFKLAYFPVPKCASTSITLLLRRLSGSTDWSKRVHVGFPGQVHTSDLSDFEGYLKFCVIRDPIKRFISGFGSRVLATKDLELDDLNELFDGRVPDINAFALKLPEISRRNLSIASHFLPQTARLGLDVSIYDHIIPIQRLSDLETVLAEHVKRPVTLPHTAKKGTAMATAPLSKSAEEFLKQYYRQDFEVLADLM